MKFSFSLVESMIEHISEPVQPKKELFQLLNQLISYFNNEIAMSISISKVFLDDDTCDSRITAYYTEHAICRIMSAWDYLFFEISILGDLSVNTANQQNKFHSYMVSCNHCYQRSMISEELIEFMDTLKPIYLGCNSED